MKVLKIVSLLAAALILLGCQVNRVVVTSPGHNHAPAFGYYYKRHPHEHRWDSELEAHVVIDNPDIYYTENYYYRWSPRHSHWERAHEPRGQWVVIQETIVPPRLVKRRAKIKKRPVPQSEVKQGRTIKHRTVITPPERNYYARYPHKHRFDQKLGLYLFLESPGTYYNNGYYYRWSVQFDSWERSREPRANWRRVHDREIPVKLVQKRNPRSRLVNERSPREKQIIHQRGNRQMEQRIIQQQKREDRQERKQAINDKKLGRKEARQEECGERGESRRKFARCDDL